MPKIAISYRRADSDAITGRIFDRLSVRYGREAVFRDIDNIPAGVDFRAHIGSVLDNSDVVLVIVGPRWMGGRGARNRLANPADPVRIEVETALRKGTPVVPVLIGRTAMPKVEQLPDSLVDFAYRNAVRVDTGQDFDLHVDRLVRAVDGILPAGRTDPARVVEGSPAAALITGVDIARLRAGWRWAVAGTPLLIVASVALWLIERSPPPPSHVPGITLEAAPQPAASAAAPSSTQPLEPPAVPADAASPTATDLKTRPQQTVTGPPAIYHEVHRELQAETRDAAGKVTVEAAAIHVLTCDGPGGNGAQIWLYAYINRRAFRVIAPPNWSTPLGGRDFANFADAASAGCSR